MLMPWTVPFHHFFSSVATASSSWFVGSSGPDDVAQNMLRRLPSESNSDMIQQTSSTKRQLKPSARLVRLPSPVRWLALLTAPPRNRSTAQMVRSTRCVGARTRVFNKGLRCKRCKKSAPCHSRLIVSPFSPRQIWSESLRSKMTLTRKLI